MSTVQKAFVFIVLVLAVLTATANLVLFAQRQNYREQVAARQAEYKQLQATLKTTTDNLQNQIGQITEAARMAESARNDLDAQLSETRGTLEQTRAENARFSSLTTELNARVAQIGSAMEQMAQRTSELETARQTALQTLEEVQQVSQQLRERNIILDRQNRELLNQVGSLQTQLQESIAQANQLQQRIRVGEATGGLIPQPSTVARAEEDTVTGKVLRIAEGGDSIFISLGSDDNVSRGMNFIVFDNQGEYVASARVYEVSADQSAARVQQPVLGTIREGYNVANQ